MSDDRDVMIQKISDQMEKVADSVDSVKECMTKLDKKLDLHIQRMEYEIHGIKTLDKQQNQILEHHSARSDALQKDNALREVSLRNELAIQSSRIEVLEQPRKWWQMTTKGLLWAGGIASALYAIGNLLGIF